MQAGAVRRSPDRALSLLVCDAVVSALAAWTLLCHALVFCGGSLRVLVWVTAALAVPAAVGVLVWRRRAGVGPRRDADAGEAASDATAETGESVAPSRLAAAAAGAALVCGVALWSPSFVAPWWAAVLVAAMALCWDLRRGPPAILPARGERSWEAWLWALALACAAIPLVAHFSNQDDAFYVNLAVAPGDRPAEPLLASDTLHGVPGLPLLLPIYRVHSIELLAAALAWITPLDPIEVCHLLLPACFALLVPLAWARLARGVAPRQWLWVVIGVLLVLALAGGPRRWHSNFGFVRLHQGKSVFVAVLVPLLLHQALDFARRPGPRAWLLLFAAQVAAVGSTATALWAAPVIAALGLLAGLRSARRGVGVLALGVLASAYVVALGLAFRSQAADALESWNEFDTGGSEAAAGPTDSELLPSAWRQVMGGGAWSLVMLFSIFAAWGCCAASAGRRLVLLLVAGFLLLYDPYAAGFVAEHVVGGVTFFRLFWLLPVPLLLALVLASPAGWDWLPLPRAARLAGAALIAVLLLASLPERGVLTAANKVRLQAFGLNVPPADYEAAARLVAATPARSQVLAPPEVSLWIGTFPRHPFAVVPRAMYLRYLSSYLDEEEVERRRELARPESARPSVLIDALERYALTGVCIPVAAAGTRRTLKQAGLSLLWRGASYEIWVRS